MNRGSGRSSWILFGITISANALAETYDFDVSVIYDRSRLTGSQLSTSPGGTTFNSTDIETDDLGVLGTWYFAGFSDDSGPRARAPFVDRASSASLSWVRSDQTFEFVQNSTDPSFPFGPTDVRAHQEGDSFTADVRLVSRDSGWFTDVSLFSTDREHVQGRIVRSGYSEGWDIGIGKYVLGTTAIGLSYGETDIGGSVYGIDMTHLGSIGETWQYAVDLGYSRWERNFPFGLDRDRDIWNAAVVLYPTRDFEIGASIEDYSGEGNQIFDPDSTTIEGFASWFVTENVKLSARYSVDDTPYRSSFVSSDPFVSDNDLDTFGISATFRF